MTNDLLISAITVQGLPFQELQQFYFVKSEFLLLDERGRIEIHPLKAF